MINNYRQVGVGVKISPSHRSCLLVAGGSAKIICVRVQPFSAAGICAVAHCTITVVAQQHDNIPQPPWSAEKSLEHGWSRSVLTMRVERLPMHAPAAVTNFASRYRLRSRISLPKASRAPFQAEW
ncbi:hypothetical protein QZM22_00695 [Burkholderia oklahomensis]|uniref:hypothetical protein n=1 Tax=Burkholderia oklahomensis TaxID=342113 RepID=UPI00264D9433|nr:hypothetical protein [Burkholderia oklahomensis]MDN7671078.1 hypothetical protein [Burkholderia oklahomensis]